MQQSNRQKTACVVVYAKIPALGRQNRKFEAGVGYPVSQTKQNTMAIEVMGRMGRKG